MLQIQRAAFFEGIGRVDDPDARVLDRQPAQVTRHIDRVVEGISRPLRLLGLNAENVLKVHRRHASQQESNHQQADAFWHGMFPRGGTP